MSIRTSPWPAGIPCWAELAAPDVAAARSFYAAVLGWTYRERGHGGSGHVVAEVKGAAAAGIGPGPPGAPGGWTMCFAADDAAGVADAATGAGGTVLVPPGPVGTLGRLVVATDPTGARFGVWEAGSHIGAEIVNEPGGLTWVDLRSPDPAAARAFYTAVFGHRTEPLPDADPHYSTFALPTETSPLGGMGATSAAEGHAAQWLVYFGVADAEVAASAAEGAGGTVLTRDFDTPYGRMAGVADPAGAVFWVIETDGENQPDRSG